MNTQELSIEGVNTIAIEYHSQDVIFFATDGLKLNVLKAEASSGNIKIDTMTGLLDASCSSGNIRVNALIGGCNLLVSSGNIDISN